MEKPILKSYFGDVFFEFLIHENPADTIIYLEGFPSSGSHKEMINFLFEKGYNIFVPHYKGTYQSKGLFLEKNIVKEMQNFIIELKKEVVINLWDLSKLEFKIKKLILFGSSFSGAICYGLSTLVKFDKIVLFSPVLDYLRLNKRGDEQDPNKIIPFIKRAYLNLIRFKFTDLIIIMNKFKECSPKYYLPKLKTPSLILHDPFDKIVSIRIAKEFNNKDKQIQLIEHNEGHKSFEVLKKEWPKINYFLDN